MSIVVGLFHEHLSYQNGNIAPFLDMSVHALFFRLGNLLSLYLLACNGMLSVERCFPALLDLRSVKIDRCRSYLQEVDCLRVRCMFAYNKKLLYNSLV